VLEAAYFDEQGRPVVSAVPGSARRRFTYDASGRLVERAELDTSGRPMTNAYGYSVMRYSYNEYGIETGRQLLDVNGRALNFRLTVTRVVRGSIAADSGFRVGDVLLTYDGETVTTNYDFANRLELFKGDRPREVTVERAGQIVGLDLPAGRVSGFTLEEQARRPAGAP
jgi:YD repeat-containing protein